MNKKYVGVAGGIMVAISMFLPLVNVMDVSMSLFESSSGVAIFFIICGIIVAGVSLLSKRWLNLLSVLISIVVVMLALKYYGDTNDTGAKVGIGMWVMLAGGVLSFVGAILGMLGKKQVA